MYPTDITLTGDSASTRTYALRSITDGNAIRAVATAPANQPEVLTVKHQVSSRGGIPLDRHLVRLDLSKEDSEGTVVMGSVYLTVEVPRNSAFTAAMAKDMKTQLVNFINTATYADKLLNSEP